MVRFLISAAFKGAGIAIGGVYLRVALILTSMVGAILMRRRHLFEARRILDEIRHLSTICCQTHTKNL